MEITQIQIDNLNAQYRRKKIAKKYRGVISLQSGVQTVFRIETNEEADNDLAEIYDYISRNGAGIAIKQIQIIIKRAEVLSVFPNVGKPLKGTKYKYIISSPYLIFYEIFKDYVEIMRIIDGRRDYLRVLGLKG